MTWRTAILCALVAMIFMVYGIPLAAIACYLVLFVMKPNSTDSILMGLGVLVLVALIIPLLVWLAVISVDNLIVRMLVLSLGSFVFMYLSVASKVGEVGSIVALVTGFVMTMIGMAPFGEIVTRAILYAALMAAAPMAIMLVFLLFLGPSPSTLLQRHMLRRWQAIAAAIRADCHYQLLLVHLRKGNTETDKMLKFVSLFAQLPKQRLLQLQQLNVSSYQLIAALVALPDGINISKAVRAHWSKNCESVIQCLMRGQSICLPEPPERLHLEPELVEIGRLMDSLPGVPEQAIAPSPLPQKSFFNDDVATNRSYAEFALKVTFSAVICYLTYTALQWQDIHTAMVTCYVAALGTVGETVRKLILRICGCLIGALMGIAAIIFLMPHMTNIGQLMALVFAGCMVAAWVAQGSQSISYAGVQIGLAFVLTVLQGFGPDVKISVAFDRVYGVLLGNCVLFVVFTQIWPVATSSQVLHRLRQHIDNQIICIKNHNFQLQMRAALPELIPQLQELREKAALSQFESIVLKISTDQRLFIENSIDELEKFYLKATYGEHASQIPQLQNKLIALQVGIMKEGIN